MIAVALSAIAVVACSDSGAGGRDAGDDCVDTQSDPLNCGLCGRVCVMPQATAGCDDGDCVIESCNEGYYDDDGDPLNGCELQAECSNDVSCTTECGTAGIQACAQGALESCTPPAEACNTIDDNCNGQCDEGAIGNCRIAVHRANGGGSDHLYTTDLTAASTDPYSVEFPSYFYFYTSEQPSTQVVFLCNQGSKFFITSATDCEGLGGVQATLGYWATEVVCGAVPLYRVYNAGAGNHFYTLSASERTDAINILGYVDQGIAGYVWTAP